MPVLLYRWQQVNGIRIEARGANVGGVIEVGATIIQESVEPFDDLRIPFGHV